MEEPVGFLLAFLFPFHLLGGAAVGIVLRKLIDNGFKLTSLADNGFLLLWGGMFGGIPLFFGLMMGCSLLRNSLCFWVPQPLWAGSSSCCAACIACQRCGWLRAVLSFL